jgi:hypothetical protein
LHMMLSRQKIYLVFRKRRFVCFCCGKAFTEVFSFLPKRSNESTFVKEDVSSIQFFRQLFSLSLNDFRAFA